MSNCALPQCQRWGERPAMQDLDPPVMEACEPPVYWHFGAAQGSSSGVPRRRQCQVMPRAFPRRAHHSPSLSTGWQCLPSATATWSCRCCSTHPPGEQPKTLGRRVPGNLALPGARAWPLGTACGDRDMGRPGQEVLLARVGTSSTSQGVSAHRCTLGWLLVTSPAVPLCLSTHPAAAHLPGVPSPATLLVWIGRAWWEICFVMMSLG